MKWKEQLPKWHPLHRKPEEDKMNPGTERAIVQLVEHAMPRLAKTIDGLVDALQKFADKELPPTTAADAQAAALILTGSQWTEVLEAISSKAAQVRDGRYGNAPDDIDTERWADDLDKVAKTIEAALEDQGIKLQ